MSVPADRQRVFKEGNLFKRQRGLTHSSLKSLQFQRRYFQLTSKGLEYSDKGKLKGRFDVKRIQIVEEIPFETFRQPYCFQVGDEAEVMYFVAKSKEERDEWMQALRKEAAESRNQMLSHYHMGAYGLAHKNRWSCCGNPQRMCSGCRKVEERGHSRAVHRIYTLPAPHGPRAFASRLSPVMRMYQGVDLRETSEVISQSLPQWDPENPLLDHADNPTLDPYYGIRRRAASLDARSMHSTDTVLTEDSGKGQSVMSSRRTSRDLSIHSSIENLLRVRSDSIGKKSVMSMQSDEGVVVDYGQGMRRCIRDDSAADRMTDLGEYPHPVTVSHNENDEQETVYSHDGSASPLLKAFTRDDYQEVKRLLGDGADPNEVLHLACERGSPDILKLLISHKADVNSRDEQNDLPLMRACRGGHLRIVQLLLNSGARLDQEYANGRTPLHEAASAGYEEIVQLLMEKGADPLLLDTNNAAPYDLAYKEGHDKVMEVIQAKLPKQLRPYKFLWSTSSDSTSQEITALAFRGLSADIVVTGSKDCHVREWDTSDLTVTEDVQVPNTVLAVSTSRHHLAVGSTSVQLINTKDWNQKITVPDRVQKEESSLHLVAFGPVGLLATASVEHNTVKLWQQPQDSAPLNSKLIPAQINNQFTVGAGPGCICSLSMSPNPNQPWLVVGVQPGKQFEPLEEKQVHIYNWEDTGTSYPPIRMAYGGLGVTMYTALSPDGKYIAIACRNTLEIWEAESRSQHRDLTCDVSNDASIFSLSYSPDGAHLSVGLETGEVQVFQVNSEIPNSVFILKVPEHPSPATAMAYSRDERMLAVGHQNGLLQLWKVHTNKGSSNGVDSSVEPLQSASGADPFLNMKFHGKPLLARVGSFDVDSRGTEYHSSEDGFKLVISEGAVAKGECVTIHHGVVPYGLTGPFQYPEGWKPVSAIVWFCSSSETEFQTPIQIEIPHYIDCEHEEDRNVLAFLKAKHDDNTLTKNGQKLFRFQPVEESSLFESCSGQLSTTHFCYYCVGEKSREDTRKATFCLTTAIPFHSGKQRNWNVDFCLSYFLPTCLKLVEEQFGADYKLVQRRFKFASGADAAIKIKYPKKLDGWMLSRQSPRKISPSEVDFWDLNSPGELVEMCNRRIYPPRFSLNFSGKEASRSSVVNINFEGAMEDISIEIALELPRTASPPEAPLSINDGAVRQESNPGNGQLTLNDLKEVRKGLFPVKAKWYDIGLELDMEPKALDSIKSGISDPSTCLREMLHGYLERTHPPLPSWEAIVEALRSPVVAEEELAEQIQQIYRSAGKHSGHHSSMVVASSASKGFIGYPSTEAASWGTEVPPHFTLPTSSFHPFTAPCSPLEDTPPTDSGMLVSPRERYLCTPMEDCDTGSLPPSRGFL